MSDASSDGPDREEVDLVEVLGCVAAAGDLSMGQPTDHSVRSALLAGRLARRLGCSEPEQEAAMDATLLRWSGCTANAQEFAALLGDDILGRAALLALDEDRLAVIGRLAKLEQERASLATAHCEVAERVASRLALGPPVIASLGQVFERWDGGGSPTGLAGEQLTLPARVMTLAGDVEVLVRVHGPRAMSIVDGGSGTGYQPELVVALHQVLPAWLDELERLDPWLALRDEHPGWGSARRRPLDLAVGVLADFADLKLAWSAGLSRTAAAISRAAAELSGLDGPTATLATRGTLVSGLGRTTVSNTIWGRARALQGAEWDQVRLVPYHTERLLARCPRMATAARVASSVFERADGTGYHRGLEGGAIPPAARIGGAALAWVALRSPRPHRPAYGDDEAAAVLREDAASGRRDPVAVEAVLAVQGLGDGRSAPHPAGLTEREVNVLGLLARGLTNRQIATQLLLSPKTIGTHVEHLYRKLGVRSRAAATFVALQHSMVDPSAGPPEEGAFTR